MSYRETWATISHEALHHNYTEIKKASDKELFAVLKANAYGHGDVEVARSLEAVGCKVFCVSSLDEAIKLFNQGIRTDILIFSYVNPQHIVAANATQFIYTVPDQKWIDTVDALGLTLRLHLEVNMGMNRYGFKDPEQIQVVAKNHQLEGIYMHFQKPENTALTTTQLAGFKTIVDSLETQPTWVHVGNFALSLVADLPWINAMRVGIGLYGYRDDMDTLKPVLSLYSKVTYLEWMQAGETIGYDYTHTVDAPGYYGTMPIGYADGFDMAQATLPVMINKKPYSIVGKICMDQTMLALDETIALHDTIELIGENRTLRDIAKATNRSLYVCLTDLKERIHRIHI